MKTSTPQLNAVRLSVRVPCEMLNVDIDIIFRSLFVGFDHIQKGTLHLKKLKYKLLA